MRLELGKSYEFKMLLKAHQLGSWNVRTLITIKDSEKIYSPDKKITIKGSINNFNSPKTDAVENVKPIEIPESTIWVKVEDAIYRISGRAIQMTLTITNHGDSAVRLGEFNIAGMRFLNYMVVRDESGYPDNMLAQEGLAVSDSSPLNPSETRTIEVTASGSIWNIYNLSESSFDSDSRFAGFLWFFDASGNRQLVIIDAPLIPSII